MSHYHAIRTLRPTSVFSLDGIEVVWEEQQDGTFVAKNVLWQDPENDLPSKAEIEAQAVIEKQKLEAEQYKIARAQKYPPLSDLADALYWQAQGDDSKMTAYLAAVQAVKEKYPKGN